MADTSVVVVLEGRDSKDLIDPLTRWGYSVIAVDSMMKALERIDHHNLAAAIVEGNSTIDALEFVLNVREFDETLPVFIVRSSIDDDVRQVLQERPRVYFISTDEDDFRAKVKTTLDATRR